MPEGRGTVAINGAASRSNSGFRFNRGCIVMAPICQQRSLVHRSIALALGALVMAQAPFASAQSSATAASAAPESVEALIKELGLVESQAAVRTRKDWRVPKKIVLLGADPGTRAQKDAFAAILPSAEVVTVPNMQAAVSATA